MSETPPSPRPRPAAYTAPVSSLVPVDPPPTRSPAPRDRTTLRFVARTGLFLGGPLAGLLWWPLFPICWAGWLYLAAADDDPR